MVARSTTRPPATLVVLADAPVSANPMHCVRSKNLSFLRNPPIAINSPSLLADANPKGYFIEKSRHSCIRGGSEIKQLAECIAAAKSLNLPANAVEEIKDSKYAKTKPGTGCRCTTDEKGRGAIQLVNGRWVPGKSLMKCFFNPYKTGRDCGYDKYNCICRKGW